MKEDYDPAADVKRIVYRDELVAVTREHTFGGARHVVHLGGDGQPVRLEVHDYSRLQEYQQQIARSQCQAEAGRTEVIGRLDWAITDAQTGATLSEGGRDVRLEEVTIDLVEPPDQALVSKQVPLSTPFRFGVACGLTPVEQRSGFGLTCDRDDLHTFCWEWFTFDGPGHASKLQEAGELAVELGNPGGLWQVVRTEFLTDISIRVKVFQADPRGAFSWRVLIRKGSWMRWPSLVDGVVTL